MTDEVRSMIEPSQAVRYDGENSQEVLAWFGDGPYFGKAGFVDRGSNIVLSSDWDVRVRPGDWVIRTPDGEIHVCQERAGGEAE